MLAAKVAARKDPFKASIRDSRIKNAWMVSMKNPQVSLKPQDLLVLFKLASSQAEDFTYARFAKALQIAASEVHASIRRVTLSRLVISDEDGIRLVRSALADFVIHGAVHFFPAVMGSATRGVPTAYAAPPLKDIISQPDELPPIWPDAKGPVRGLALYPLYPSVPAIASMDSALYESLALFDALRMGAAREREIAQQMLRERL